MRLLTGRSRFNNFDVDPKCLLCSLENKDLQHFILQCPALGEVRECHFLQLRKHVICIVGDDGWSVYGVSGGRLSETGREWDFTKCYGQFIRD